MSQNVCGYAPSALWRMPKKQSMPMLISALQEVVQLRVEIKKLNEKLDKGTEQHLADTEKLNKFYMKTKEENKKLKEEIKKLKEEKQRDTIAEVRSARDRALSENKKLKEENQRMSRFLESREIKYCEKCREYNEETEGFGYNGVFQDSEGEWVCDDCHEVEIADLIEENKKLKEKVKHPSLSDFMERAELNGDYKAFVKEYYPDVSLKEVGLYESDEEEPPDCCVSCDTRFDLHYTMNNCDGIQKGKYNDYFGSEKDDGDLCPDCINTIC